jgi:uncharacterized iron-regulated protein
MMPKKREVCNDKTAVEKVAVGLEMFRSDSRADLDRWVAGGIDEARFKAIYLDNWNYPWKLYAPIFEYARRQKIALVGLKEVMACRGTAARNCRHF